ncbi:MAG: Gfo/Idh/MocA family oxidoreductase [Rhodobacteraceae bacterium]|nr:Gfo/Idh/MocA family oxidoreductase [Paracoccaceae bacterium]
MKHHVDSNNEQVGSGVTLIGCGFVADLYMRSFAAHPEICVHGAFDNDTARMAAFCTHWGIAALPSLKAAYAVTPKNSLIVNLTNPTEHAGVIRSALEAGFNVWSEKPMTMALKDAVELNALAQAKGLQLASAPSSVLSQAAQTLAKAVRDGHAGTPRLIYAELDDGFIPQAPLEMWASESGAPWPVVDEFRTGCTLEHAGYYLSWLIAMFGAVTRVASVPATVLPDKLGVTDAAPDFAVAVLWFEGGPVARLTCSIVAPHDHRIRVIGDTGVLEMPRAWDNGAPVRLYKRKVIRRRLLELPIGRKVKIKGETHPHLPRWGAASMNFALGPAEMLGAIAAGRVSRLSGAYAVHLTEVTLAVQAGGDQEMTTTCSAMEPMPWAL